MSERIELGVVAESLKRVAEYLAGLEVESVDFGPDYYWNLMPEDRYDKMEQHKALTSEDIVVGELSYDYRRLIAMVNSEVELSYDMVYVGEILQYVGHVLFSDRHPMVV